MQEQEQEAKGVQNVSRVESSRDGRKGGKAAGWKGKAREGGARFRQIWR